MEQDTNVLTCINCGAEGTGKYCDQCGQRKQVKRINFKEAWFDFWARIYGFDGMFPRTLVDLTLRPGFAATAYIKGNRARYYGPVGYFFLMITLLYLVASLLSIDIMDFMKNASNSGLQPEIKQGSGQEKFMQETMALVSDNLKLVSFIFVPLQAFCARYLFFRKSGYNFLEHTILLFLCRATSIGSVSLACSCITSPAIFFPTFFRWLSRLSTSAMGMPIK